MTYRHLISRRNAALRRSAIATSLLLAACGDALPSDTGLVPESPTFTELVAAPDNPVLAPAQTTALRASGVTADGRHVPIRVEWDLLDGGSLRETVLDSQTVAIFTATSPGAHRIVGRGAGGTLRDTATIVVPSTAETRAITGLMLAPREVAAEAGDTLSFQVHGFTASGDTVPAPTTLAAGAGTVRGLHVVVDGQGRVPVVATLSGSSLQDTAWVTVGMPAAPAPVAPAPAPAPSDGGGGTPQPGSAPELPRVLLDTRYQAPTGKTIRVAADGNLQAALDAAVRGDLVELAPGATYIGNFTLPAKAGTGWITIRTGTALPAEGSRVTPSVARSSRFARLVTPNAGPALETAGSPLASQYRVMGVEIAGSYAGLTHALVFLGDPANAATSTAALPTDIILDRVYIHGTPTQQLQRCLVLNNRRGALIDSYVSECHMKGNDSQAIIGWAGPGPYKIVNNYLAGAGENIMFGGADPKIAGLVPSDIEIRRNHIHKPESWKSSRRWTVKNLYESKNSQRVLLEDNIFENNWIDAQTGLAIVLKSENQSGRCTWCTTADYTFRYNKLFNSPGGFMITGSQVTVNGGPSVPAARITIAHTLFDGVAVRGPPAARRLFQIGPKLRDLVVRHNSGFPDGYLFFLAGTSGSETQFDLRDNLFGRGTTGIFGSGMAEGLPSLLAFAPKAMVRGNGRVGAAPARYPPGNVFPESAASAGLIGTATGWYRLGPATYASTTTDGTSAGVNIPELERRLSGVK